MYKHVGFDNGRTSAKRAWPFGECNEWTRTPISTPTDQLLESTQSPTRIEYVCFGSIIDVKAQLLRTGWRSLPQSASEVQTFSIVQEGKYFGLQHSGVIFARLNKQSCRLLNLLVAERDVFFSAAVPGSEWSATLKSYQNQGQCIMTLEANIYGVKSDAEEIGSLLSRSNTYLQFPQFGCGAEYYNPHFFRIEGYSDRIPLEASEENDSSQIGTQSLKSNQDPKISDSAFVDSILDSLSHRVDVGTITVDRRIKSTLLPHQKAAIDFISRRETGQLVSNISLWQYNDTDADEPFYQHVFTGAKRPQRNEERGGIIADEMGLGKSLVILSTVAGSLSQAEEFIKFEDDAQAGTQGRKIRTRATLVVAPSSLLIDSWVDEIRKHAFPGALSFHRHLGSGRHGEKDLLQQRMIVFTTYATVATEFCRGNSILAQVHWFRIVLDEAHDIRNRSTKQFQAVSSLSAEHRWCLTGTPIQNGLEDLGALATFLRVPILEHAPTFRKFITNPITSGSKERFQNLRLLLRTICLRRTRELLNLPEPIPHIRKLSLSPHEKTEYNDLLRKCRLDIDMAVSGRRKGKLNSTVLESLLKLRLFCNNGSVGSASSVYLSGLPTDPDEALAYLQQIDRNICAYCSGTIYSLNDEADADGAALLPSCQHLVCRTCMPQHWVQKQQCPSCATGEEMLSPKSPIISSQTQPSAVPHSASYPTKLRALLTDLSRNTSHKSIVFSCWKKTLTLMGKLLSYRSIRYDMIDGSLSLTERIKVLNNFRSPSGVNILLMTLGTGAVGLNLAVASRIYLLEPQWNPSIESQAIGRALRLGQTAQVVIMRYIMRDTVEESNVLSRQRTKLQLAGGGFGKSKDSSSEQLQAMLDVFGFKSTAGT